MAWVESHQGLGKHPKTLKASRLLGIDKVPLVGHLHYLWWWALDNAEDGSLRGRDVEEIAAAAEWPSNPRSFVDALLAAGRDGQAGFLEGPEGDLAIHDWHDHTKRLQENRRRYQESKAAGGRARAAMAQRENGRFISVSPAEPAAHQQPTSSTSSVLDQQHQQHQLTKTITLTNQAISNHPPIAPAVACVREKNPKNTKHPGFEDFRDAYPKRCPRISWTDAQKAWDKHKPPHDEVIAALDWQDKEYSDWQRTDLKGEYSAIEAPAVWINKGNWGRVRPQKLGSQRDTQPQAAPKGILEGIPHLQARRRAGDGPEDWENWYEMVAAEDADLAKSPWD